jgi:hypothetical protein
MEAAVNEVVQLNPAPLARTALTTLLKLVNNVLSAPDEPKFRRVSYAGSC